MTITKRPLREILNRARTISKIPEWKAFKEKWDGNVPRKGTKKHDEYNADCVEVQKAIDKYMKA